MNFTKLIRIINNKYYQELRNKFDSLAISLKPMFNDINGIHGLGHAKRVYILVNLIADNECLDEETREILIYCALYHDIGRTDNGYGYMHGIESYKKIIENNLINSDYKYLEIVKFIIENHNEDDDQSIERVNKYNIEDKYEAIYLYRAFKDADNLDRVRICNLDIKFLRLKSSKRLVDIAYGLYYKSMGI